MPFKIRKTKSLEVPDADMAKIAELLEHFNALLPPGWCLVNIFMVPHPNDPLALRPCVGAVGVPPDALQPILRATLDAHENPEDHKITMTQRRPH